MRAQPIPAPDETQADREAVERYWCEMYRQSAERGIEAPPRTIANVRAASTAARWVALVLGVVLALLAVVGLAYVWTDPVPSPAPLESDRRH